MAFLINDDAYRGVTEVVDAIDDVLEYFRDQEVSERGGYDEPTVYEIVRKVEIVTNPATYSVVNPSTDIPAPLAGETVSDYARRISGGA